KQIYIYKITKHSNKNLIFIDEPKATAKYYNDINIFYKQLLQQKGYNVTSKSIMINNTYNTTLTKINQCIELKDNIFILNPINFATLLFASDINNSFKLINSIKYIVLWQEILNNDLTIVGYHRINNNFLIQFFK